LSKSARAEVELLTPLHDLAHPSVHHQFCCEKAESAKKSQELKSSSTLDTHATLKTAGAPKLAPGNGIASAIAFAFLREIAKPVLD